LNQNCRSSKAATKAVLSIRSFKHRTIGVQKLTIW